MSPTNIGDDKKTSATFADVSLNCRPILDGRPITAIVKEVSGAHLPSTLPLGMF